MTNSASRVITLTLNANTTGSETVKALAEEMKQLAKAGGDAAPEAEKLAKELDSLAKQQSAVENMQALSLAAEDARVAFDRADTEVKAHTNSLQQLRAQLDQASAAEGEQAAKLKAAQLARVEAKASYESARAALAQYTAEIGGAKSANSEEKRALDEKRDALRALKAAYEESKANVSALVPEMIRLKDATAPLAVEFAKQQRELRALATESAGAKQAVGELESALKQSESAAKTLGVDTSKLTDEQNRLAQSMAVLVTKSSEVKAAIAAPGAAALSSAERIQQAFGVIGVQSANAVKDEILRVNNALMTLAREANVSGDEFNRAFTAGRARIAELEKQLSGAEVAARKAGDGFGAIFKQFSAGAIAFNAVQAGINAVVSAAKQVPKVAAEFQSVDRALTIITGSSRKAAEEFEYVKGVANRVGADLKGMADSYVKLTAATKDTSLAGAETRRIFEAVSGAMGMLGSSSSETQHAMMAVTQMVSKGVVSMEEMRQQLAERLPGAFQATAKQLGITTSDLNTLISTGQLTAEQVLPALARGLEDIYKTGSQNDTLIGKWRNFTNALKEASIAAGDTKAFEMLLSWLRPVAAAVQGCVEWTMLLGRAYGLLAAAMTTGDFKGAWEEFKMHVSDAGGRLMKTAGFSDDAKKSISELAADARKSGQEFITMSDGTKIAVAQLEGLNESMVKNLLESAKAEKQAEIHETNMRKMAEATRSAGEAAITAANAVGDEAEKRRVATMVAAENAKALDVLLKAEKSQLDILEKRKKMFEEEMKRKTGDIEVDKNRLENLQKEIDKQQGVVDATNKRVEANNALRNALSAEAAALEDNSTKLEKFRDAYLEYQRVIDGVRRDVEAGNLTQAQASELEEEYRRRKFMFIDALKDQKEKTEALANAKKAQFELDTKGIDLSIAKQKSLQQTAKLMGDEYGARMASIEIQKLEIEKAEIEIKIKEAEARASLEVTKAKREELQAKDKLNAAAEAELKAAELGAQSKLKEAEISKEGVKQMKELYDITLMYGDAAAMAGKGADSLANSLDKTANSAEKAKDKIDELNGTKVGENNDGYGTREERRGSISGEQFFQHKILAMGLDWEISQKAITYAMREFSQLAAKASQTAVSSEDYNRRMSGTENLAIERAIEKAQAEAEAASRKDQTGGQASGAVGGYDQAQNTSPAISPVTVNVNLGSQQGKVQVASQQDAQALVDMFKTLEQQSRRTF